MVKIIENSPLLRILSSSKAENSKKKLEKDLRLENLAWESGFYKKKPKKITASGLIFGFWEMQDNGKNSLREWAVSTGKIEKKEISKNGINDRLDDRAVSLVKAALSYCLKLKINGSIEAQKRQELEQLCSLFNNILVQDSTCQKVPANLSKIFKSSYSKTKTTATVRIQAIFNFTTMDWVVFDIGAYTDNDQSQALMITKVAQKNDLILRDLGYFTTESIGLLIKNQYVITKWDNRTNLYDAETGEKIDLVKLFKHKRVIDIFVLLGKKAQLKMRLVAKKLPKLQADKRKKEARKDRNKKANHSEEYFKLIQWEIYLTNIPIEMVSVEQVAKLYGLRWYIEILFNPDSYREEKLC